jgi:neutral ceramidase
MLLAFVKDGQIDQEERLMRMRTGISTKVRFQLALALVLALSAPCTALFGATTGWKAGRAKVNITPERSIWMSGYASRDKPAQGKLTDLWAKCLVLEDGDGTRAVLVTMDLIGLGRTLSLRVRRQMQEAYQLPLEAILLSASHTHTGPVVGDNLRAMYFYDDAQAELVKAYADTLERKLLALVRRALSDLQPAHLEWGGGQTDFAVNRRNNAQDKVPQLRAQGKLKGPVDHDVPVLAVREQQGRLSVILCGYACHATTLASFELSGDWPGFAQNALEQRHAGVQAMVWAGCGADQNPLPRRKVELARKYGKMLADAVEGALSNGLRPVQGKLTAEYAEIDLPWADLPSREELEATTTSKNPYEASRAKLLLERLRRNGELSPTYPFPIQTWRLGKGPTLIALGGEVVVDYALRLKAELGLEKTWVMAYANDVMAYIPSRRVLDEGGYEGVGAMLYYGQPGAWKQSVEALVVSEVHRQLESAPGRSSASRNP